MVNRREYKVQKWNVFECICADLHNIKCIDTAGVMFRQLHPHAEILYLTQNALLNHNLKSFFQIPWGLTL
jgi:hypothetical protein